MSTGIRWNFPIPANRPAPRTDFPLVADPVRGYVLAAFGEWCGTEVSTADRWDGSNWTSLGTYAPVVGSAKGITGCYDTANSKVVLFGGFNPSAGNCGVNATRTYDGTAFATLAPAHKPSPRWSAPMAYCPALGKVVLFGGFNSANSCGQAVPPAGQMFQETWTWDGTDWTQVFPAHSPPVLGSLATLGSNVYGWGGPYDAYQNLTQLWKFDGTDWTVVTPGTPSAPSNRAVPAFGAWPSQSKIFLGGGKELNAIQWVYPDDNWTFDGTSWTLEAPCGGVFGNYDANSLILMVAEDPNDHQMMLVGGEGVGVNPCSPADNTSKLEAYTNPVAVTGVADNNVCSAATLHGTVTPNDSGQVGLNVQVYFDWGPTAAYGTSYHAASLPDGTTPVAVSAALLGFSPGATYHFRIRAVGACVTVVGADATFVEGVCVSNQPQLNGYFDLSAP